MNENIDMIVEPFRGLVTSLSTSAAVREAEKSDSVHPMWAELEESGFLDLVVPEQAGGAGLALDSLFALTSIAGEVAMPVPYGETAFARALFAGGDVQLPDAAVIVLAPQSAIIPHAQYATHAVVESGDRLCLNEITSAGGDPFGTGGGEALQLGVEVASATKGNTDLLASAAALTAASMAGTMVNMQQMAITHVSEREQFGRPLSKFQAIQQQLAVLAEQVASAYLAARIGLSGDQVDPVRAAMAKCRVSEAAHQVSAIAHAVHGAIGATEEYDLQLYSRRLKQGQLAFGSESYWAERLAEARLAAPSINGADFIRLNLQEMGDT